MKSVQIDNENKTKTSFVIAFAVDDDHCHVMHESPRLAATKNLPNLPSPSFITHENAAARAVFVVAELFPIATPIFT